MLPHQLTSSALPNVQSQAGQLTDRQARERDFYDTYASQVPRRVVFGPVAGKEKRPWNPYWRVHGYALAWYHSPTQRVLDFGCGYGDTSVRLASIGYRVFGFDVSPANIDVARALGEKYGFANRIDFSVQPAESLIYEDNFFDVIVGIDILHHVDIPTAIRECLRVLAPGARAVFHEPVEAPLIEPLRNSRLGRWFAPKTPSFDRHITEDERKLSRSDLRLIESMVGELTVEPFYLFAHLDRFYRRPKWLRWSPLERLDAFLFRWLPPLRIFRGKIVLTFSKPDVHPVS